MRGARVAALALALAVVRCSGVELGCDGGCTVPSLGELSGDDLQLGLAVNHLKEIVFQDEEVDELIQTNFADGGVLTAENGCKMKYVQPERGVFNFEYCDRSYNYSMVNGMDFRLHTLVWDKQIPEWVTKLKSKKDLETVMKEHIQTVLARYPDARFIDVLNEAHRVKNFKPWKKIKNYAIKAFQFADQVREEGQLLVINENSADLMNYRSKKLFALTKKLRAKGLVDAVGLQMHLICSQIQVPKNFASMKKNLKRFNDLGVDIHLTEIDIRGCDSEEEMADSYRALTELCLQFPRCTVMQFWGPADSFSWKNVGKDVIKRVLPFNSDLEATLTTLLIAETVAAESPP